jgi:hypothetical protein
MQTALIIFFVIVAIFSAAVIISAIRKSLRHRAIIRRRLAEIGARHTGKWPLFAIPYGSENFHPDWGGRAEVTSEASLYQRVRSARMNEIIRAADSMSYDDLMQAAIRLGSTQEIAAAYAAEILISEDEGEELPAAMAHSPNVGGIGQPRYRGGNYVDEHELVDEMKGVRHYGTEPAVDPLTSLLTTGRVPITGYRNPIRALAAGVKACGAKIDTASFDRLAEQRGDSRPEEIADGFIIRGYDDLQRLCELGNVVIATDPTSGLVVCHDPAEWQDSQAQPYTPGPYDDDGALVRRDEE